MPRKMFALFITIIFAFLALAAWAVGVYFHYLASNASPSGEAPALQTVKAFFGNSNLNPGAMDCSLVYPVVREVAKTPAVGRAALSEMLKGPSQAEKNGGYYTSINEGVEIRSLSISDGVARVDFGPRLEEAAGGSCRVAAIRAQITETLKQFPTVDSVVISIDGRTEDILQP